MYSGPYRGAWELPSVVVHQGEEIPRGAKCGELTYQDGRTAVAFTAYGESPAVIVVCDPPDREPREGNSADIHTGQQRDVRWDCSRSRPRLTRRHTFRSMKHAPLTLGVLGAALLSGLVVAWLRLPARGSSGTSKIEPAAQPPAVSLVLAAGPLEDPTHGTRSDLPTDRVGAQPPGERVSDDAEAISIEEAAPERSARWLRVTPISEEDHAEYIAARLEFRERLNTLVATMTRDEIIAMLEGAFTYQQKKTEMLRQRRNSGFGDLYRAAFNDDGSLQGPGSHEMPEGYGPLMKVWGPTEDPEVVSVTTLAFKEYRELYEQMWTAQDLLDVLKH